MDQTPYEILQLIASNLLPRYQCRLALTSKWCYLHLYNDLLHWHAKWALIKPIKCRIINNKMSLREYNKKVVCTSMQYLAVIPRGVLSSISILTMHNLTDYAYGSINDAGSVIVVSKQIIARFENIEYLPVIYRIHLFDGFYKYMHRDVFTLFASIRISPLLSLPLDILTYIRNKLDWDTIRMLSNVVHPHLKRI